ncbi:MAG: NADH:flavin oxidoreductase [Spirochaetota bacterium]
MELTNLFSPFKIGNKISPNRFAVQPMESNDAAEGGRVSERALERYKTLAKGGWGIVNVEALSISETSIARINEMIIKRDNLHGFKRLVEEFKKINPHSIFIFQINHSGRNSGKEFSRRTSICPVYEEGMEYLATQEIDQIQKDFIQGALLCEEAGADGVDFKMCHGYFGSELLRPCNTRNDKWGGTFNNRTRLLWESIPAIRSQLKNKDFLIGSRISMFEGIRGGCGTSGPDEIIEDLSEMLEVVQLMDKLGMDFVNVSAGIPALNPEITRPNKSNWRNFLNHFRYTKIVKELNTGMAVVGSAYSVLKEDAPFLGEENIRKGYTDFVGFGRQSFADPLLPKRIKRGEKINWCTACSGCSRLMIGQKNDGCVIYNDYYKQLYRELQHKKKQ